MEDNSIRVGPYEDEKEENRRFAGYVIGGTAIAIIIALCIVNALSLGLARKRISSLESQIETLQETQKTLKNKLEEAQLENAKIQNDLKKAENEIDTRDEEIAIYKDSLEEISATADEIGDYINNIRSILGLEVIN